MTDRIVLPRLDDFHIHLRQGSALGAYTRTAARCFGRVLAMPNTLPPVSTPESVSAYRNQIQSEAAGSLIALVAFKLLPGMTAATVRACASAGAIAGKYYPVGATTHASDGIPSPDTIEEALSVMEEEGLVLSIHGEHPAAPVLEREDAFLPILESIMERHPRLKIVLEHLSTSTALNFVLAGPPTLAGTVTAHHLLFSIEDLLADGMQSHLYCKPVLKSLRHRDTLRRAVFGAAPRIFFGSDSAPHPRAAKERIKAAAGVYSAPTAIPALVQLFEEEATIATFEGFVAAGGAAFYGLPHPCEGQLILERRPWTVPEEIDGAVPMLAGQRLEWSIVD